jgi:hypothetical protein
MDNLTNMGIPMFLVTNEDLEHLVTKTVKETLAALNDRPAQTETMIGVSQCKADEADRYITRKEASELLHVDFSTLWRWNRDGLLLSKKAGPRRVMYRYADVLAVLGGKCAVTVGEGGAA